MHVPADYSTIQEAVDVASDGNTILIADGTYSGAGNTGIQWDATNKHLAIISANGQDHCIIDCMAEARGIALNQGLNQGQDRRDVIEGLSIINGRVQGAGGAIYISSASPVIKHCLLAHNSAVGYHDNSYSGCGGAIMVLNESDPLLRICDLKGLVLREVKLDLGQVPVPADFNEHHKGIIILTVMSRGTLLYRQKVFTN